jgi:acyl carrier protein
MDFREKIIELVKENLENKEVNVTGESLLEDDLGFDSFATVMLVNSIEDEFGINIDVESVKDTLTVNDIIEKLAENYPEIAEKK